MRAVFCSLFFASNGLLDAKNVPMKIKYVLNDYTE